MVSQEQLKIIKEKQRICYEAIMDESGNCIVNDEVYARCGDCSYYT